MRHRLRIGCYLVVLLVAHVNKTGVERGENTFNELKLLCRPAMLYQYLDVESDSVSVTALVLRRSFERERSHQGLTICWDGWTVKRMH